MLMSVNYHTDRLQCEQGNSYEMRNRGNGSSLMHTANRWKVLKHKVKYDAQTNDSHDIGKCSKRRHSP